MPQPLLNINAKNIKYHKNRWHLHFKEYQCIFQHKNNTQVTPIRNTLGVVTDGAPSATPSKQISRAINSSNQLRSKGARPITNPAFEKRCVDYILDFLLRILHIFSRSYIYGFLVPHYKIVGRPNEEIPSELKLLGYSAQMLKRTFVSVSSPHSWPTLLATISKLCDNCIVFYTSISEKTNSRGSETQVNIAV